MRVKRRSCLALLGASFVGQGLSTGTANAQTTVTVQGEVESAVGASVDSSVIEFISPANGIFRQALIENESFEVSLEGDTSYQVVFWHEEYRGDYKTAIDDVPLVYDLEEDLQIRDEDVDLGTFEIPEGHEVQVRFEDPNGNPVQGLFIGFRTNAGSGTGPQSFFTNSEGYVHHANEDEPGVELVGDVDIEVLSPKDNRDFINPRQLSVTEPQEVTVTIQNPDEWGGEVVKSDTSNNESETNNTESNTTTDNTETEEAGSGTTTDGSRANTAQSKDEAETGEERGFITNDSDSSLEFLEDPVTLTWGGIFVSILGITVQLLGGN